MKETKPHKIVYPALFPCLLSSLCEGASEAKTAPRAKIHFGAFPPEPISNRPKMT